MRVRPEKFFVSSSNKVVQFAMPGGLFFELMAAVNRVNRSLAPGCDLVSADEFLCEALEAFLDSYSMDVKGTLKRFGVR